MTKFLIITSLEDKASMNMRDHLLNDTSLKFKVLESKWHDKPLYQLESHAEKIYSNDFFESNEIYIGLTEDPLIHLDDLRLRETDIEPDLLIFASRHRSETSRPAFLTHTTGNWDREADFGGNPQELSIASAILLKAGLISLEEQVALKKMQDFSLDIEVTHHGPSNLEKPLIFMELGSSEEEWEIKAAGNLVAHAILETCFKYSEFKKISTLKIGLGFGGPHYAPNFKRIMENSDVAISFICPKYFIQGLNEDMIEQMINNNVEKVDYFIIDWKGTNSADKNHLVPILENFDIPIKKTKDF